MGSDFLPSFGNVTKVKITSEIKPPLREMKETLQDFPLFSIFVWQSSLCIVVAGNVVENTCPRGSDSRLKYRITLVTYY